MYISKIRHSLLFTSYISVSSKPSKIQLLFTLFIILLRLRRFERNRNVTRE